VAVHITLVFPIEIKTEPSAVLIKFRCTLTVRISFCFLPSGLIYPP
jgi:hypothetical protein